MFKRLWLAGSFFLLLSSFALAKSYLFYLEAQGVAGYSSALKKGILYSLSQEDAMQKPSLGFDYIQQISGETRDYGAFALQVRLAFNYEGSKKFEFQVYNGYFKYKAGFSDFWIGHNRPALGLSSTLDSHSLLLPTLAMKGFGFDRDWGLGFSKDLDWGNLAVSFTTGSGMPLYCKGNYLGAVRVSKGVLNRDNYSLGLSLAYGKPLETMGYHLMSQDPISFQFMGADWTYLWNNFENRVEVMAGRKMERNAYALFWRLGMNFLAENRLKIETQPFYWKVGKSSDCQLSGGITYQLSADIALRSMYQYVHGTNDHRIIFQVYYYKRA
jgi:hypothetical protein